MKYYSLIYQVKNKFNKINELSLTWLTKYLIASKCIKYAFVI